MRMQQQCTETQFLSRLVEDELEANERRRLELHLESCDTCQSALDSFVDADAAAARVGEHLRRSKPLTDPVLLQAMKQIRSTESGLDVTESVRLADFAVDYLRPSDDPKALGRLGPYEISEVIGCGGMGIVLKGLDSKLNRVVALKVLTPVLALNSAARKRFMREAQAAAAVGHSNVVTIYSVDEDRLPYLVMEFVDGPSLQQKLDSEGFLHLNQILRIGIQVASGLAAAHAQGLVHRDIKPGNILLEKGMERVKLTDFGLARAADDATMTREGNVVGTPQYMSPEQARGEPVDQTSDLFSLGSVLYALATGRTPFRAESSYGVMRRITDENPTPLREINPEIPDWLSAIIEKLLAKEKKARFQSATQLSELLEACLSHAQHPTVNRLPDIPTLSRGTPVPRISKPLLGVVAMVSLAITGLIFALVGPPLANPEPKSEREIEPTKKSQTYEQTFVVDFPNPDETGTLNVDIKRGSIFVTGYDGEKLIVELEVPNYSPSGGRSADGLQELRSNTLDFDIEKSDKQIKVDGNSYEYITNLKIKVPRTTNLILDSYRDGLLQVRRVKGAFKIRSHNNNIRLEEVSGAGRVWSYNGSLTADFEAVPEGQPLHLETYNGSIDLMLPPDMKANAKYRSGSGKVLSDFDVALANDVVQSKSNRDVEIDEFVRGTLNGGGPTLTLETEKGDIILKRRMGKSIRN